jgi:signal transduction histidine kinase
MTVKKGLIKERLAAFPELNPNPVIAVDAKGRAVYLNPSAEKLFPDLRRLKDKHPYLKDIREILAKLSASKKKEFYREVAVRGKWFYQWFCYTSSQRMRLRVYGLDITKRKRDEEALRHSNSLLASTLESIFGGLLVVNRQGRIVRFNARFSEMWGIPESILASGDDRKALDFVVSQLKDPEAFLRKVRELYKSPRLESHDYFEFNDGRVFERYSRPHIKGEKIVGRVWSFIDITERRRSEEALRQSEERFRGLAETFERQVRERTEELVRVQVELERSKRLSDIGLLASTVAHELRNPLAAINMAAHNIEKKANNPDLTKHLDRIKTKIAESDQIINNLLFYSRLKPPFYECVNMCEMIQESIDAICSHVCAGVSIVRKLDELRDLSIDADPLQVKEVLINLLSNACDALPPKGGLIEIAGKNEDSFVEVSVTDNGNGISKETLSRIFDPFFSTKARGTGLGLPVCKQIIHYHGGQIRIESEVGKGTTVSITLPKSRRVDPEKKSLEKSSPA